MCSAAIAVREDLISASGYPSAIQFVGALPVVAGSRSVDAALGRVTNLPQTFPGVVRSFGDVQGVKVPSAGLWIRKNSVKSGITIGLDKGEVNITAEYCSKRFAKHLQGSVVVMIPARQFCLKMGNSSA
jgi:hypothetical protein